MFMVITLRCLRMGRIQRIAELLSRVEKLIDMELKKAMKVASAADTITLYEPETSLENTERLTELIEVASAPEPRKPHEVVARENKIKRLSRPARKVAAPVSASARKVAAKK